jgi:pimeloyl-ACP methyl ester carboxylesterase
MLLSVALWGATGCASPADLATADRYARGLVMILPGIEGRGPINLPMARGLDAGGVPSAIEVYQWGTGAGAGLLVNLTALERNRHSARRIAERITQYQDDFPRRPVHLIGHSGGAGIAVLTLEHMPDDRQITAAYLLAPAVSPTYDLTDALRRTELGVWNFYSPRDVGFLRVGTSVFGTIDRTHTSAAGAVGFEYPPDIDEEGKRLYARKLHSAPHNKRMKKAGARGSHLGWATERFARKWLAEMILSDMRAVAAPAYHVSGRVPAPAARPAVQSGG